jgi:hypothetical protein
MADHPVYVTGEIEAEFTAGLERIPQGLAFRLEEDGGFRPTTMPVLCYRPLHRSGRLEDRMRRLYADALAARGGYYLSMGGDRGEAEKSLKMALEFDRSSPAARFWMQKMGG